MTEDDGVSELSVLTLVVDVVVTGGAFVCTRFIRANPSGFAAQVFLTMLPASH